MGPPRMKWGGLAVGVSASSWERCPRHMSATRGPSKSWKSSKRIWLADLSRTGCATHHLVTAYPRIDLCRGGFPKRQLDGEPHPPPFLAGLNVAYNDCFERPLLSERGLEPPFEQAGMPPGTSGQALLGCPALDADSTMLPACRVYESTKEHRACPRAKSRFSARCSCRQGPTQ